MLWIFYGKYFRILIVINTRLACNWWMRFWILRDFGYSPYENTAETPRVRRTAVADTAKNAVTNYCCADARTDRGVQRTDKKENKIGAKKTKIRFRRSSRAIRKEGADTAWQSGWPVAARWYKPLFRSPESSDGRPRVFSDFRVSHFQVSPSTGRLVPCNENSRSVVGSKRISGYARRSVVQSRQTRNPKTTPPTTAAGTTNTRPGTLIRMRQQRDNVVFRFGAHALSPRPHPRRSSVRPTTIRQPCSLSRAYTISSEINSGQFNYTNMAYHVSQGNNGHGLNWFWLAFDVVTALETLRGPTNYTGARIENFIERQISRNRKWPLSCSW